MMRNRLRLLTGLVVCGALVLVACGDEDSPTSAGGRGNSTGDAKRFSLPGGAAMEFVWIEGGTFFMGSPPSEEWRWDDEGPVHEVEISAGFWLGRYEVTQGQWEAVMGWRPWSGSEYESGKEYVVSDPSHPAVYISWKDVQVFITKLNSAAGAARYRLPSEAEWEYACRAGTRTRWSFGNDERQLTDYAWYGANRCDVGGGCYGRAVGLKGANPWGLHDMYGNVWEWVQDWHDGDYYERSPRVDPPGPETGSFFRVLRGGSFLNLAQDVRSAYRLGRWPELRYYDMGVRLLRTP